MKAFLGVISFCKRPYESGDNLNTDLLYGHPVQTLPKTFLWTPREHNTRRRNLRSRQDGLPAIPSWSWMAWQHDARAELSMYPSLVSSYKDLNTPTIVHAQCSTCLQTHETSTKGCNNEASLEHIDPECLHPYLYIEAQRGRFSVSKQLEGDEKKQTFCHLCTLCRMKNLVL